MKKLLKAHRGEAWLAQRAPFPWSVEREVECAGLLFFTVLFLVNEQPASRAFLEYYTGLHSAFIRIIGMSVEAGVGEGWGVGGVGVGCHRVRDSRWVSA